MEIRITPDTNSKPHCSKCGRYLDTAPNNYFGWCSTCEWWAQTDGRFYRPFPEAPSPYAPSPTIAPTFIWGQLPGVTCISDTLSAGHISPNYQGRGLTDPTHPN